MSSTDAGTDTQAATPAPGTIDMKIEVVALPVSDVDRAKRFYQGLGWRLDVDFDLGGGKRVVQRVPLRSPGPLDGSIFKRNKRGPFSSGLDSCGEGQPVAPVLHGAGREQLAAIGWTARREVDLDVERREAGAAAGGGLCTAAADFARRVFRRAWSAL